MSRLITDIWRDDKGDLLMTQPMDIFMHHPNYPILTVSENPKSQNVYLVNPDETVVLFRRYVNAELYDQYFHSVDKDATGDWSGLYMDNAIIPSQFCELAEKMGARVQMKVYDHLCRYFMQHYYIGWIINKRKEGTKVPAEKYCHNTNEAMFNYEKNSPIFTDMHAMYGLCVTKELEQVLVDWDLEFIKPWFNEEFEF